MTSARGDSAPAEVAGFEADAERTRELLARFSQLSDEEFLSALEELGRLGRRSPTALQLLLQGLDKPAVLYLALAKVGAPAIPGLRAVVREGPERKSIRALKALAEIPDQAAANAVIEALEDPSFAVRFEAWELLEVLDERSLAALPQMRRALVAPEHPNILGPVLLAIEGLGPAAADALPELERLLRGVDVSDVAKQNVEFETWIPIKTAGVLAALGRQGGLTVLRFTGDSRPNLRAEIAAIIGEQEAPAPEAIAALGALAADEQVEVAESAWEAVLQLGARAAPLMLSLEELMNRQAGAGEVNTDLYVALKSLCQDVLADPERQRLRGDARRILDAMRAGEKRD
ncbi:MAG: HEAT repeat domain-containing protein [Planctomycetota bacterium]